MLHRSLGFVQPGGHGRVDRFLVPTAAFLAGGFYKVYRKPKASAGEGESYCTSPVSDRINKVVLWSASVLVLAALAFPYLAPLLLDI